MKDVKHFSTQLAILSKPLIYKGVIYVFAYIGNVKKTPSLASLPAGLVPIPPFLCVGGTGGRGLVFSLPKNSGGAE